MITEREFIAFNIGCVNDDRILNEDKLGMLEMIARKMKFSNEEVKLMIKEMADSTDYYRGLK